MTHILLIEDNPIDARLMTRVLSAEITWIDDGQKALWYLHALEAGGVEQRPALVLLDLHLPKYDGLQVLAEFRKSAAGVSLPIFMLSSTPAPEVAELARERNLQADAYLEKPYGLAELDHFGQRIGEWIAINSSEARTVAA